MSQRIISLVAAMCLFAAGCTMQSADRLAGFTPVKLKAYASKGVFGGSAFLETSADFQGKADMSIDPETRDVTSLHIEVGANVSDVMDAQGRRLNENFLALRNMESQLLIRQQEIAAASIVDILSAVTTIADRYGPTTAQEILGGVSSLLPAGGLDLASLLNLLQSQSAVVPKETKVEP